MMICGEKMMTLGDYDLLFNKNNRIDSSFEDLREELVYSILKCKYGNKYGYEKYDHGNYGENLLRYYDEACRLNDKERKIFLEARIREYVLLVKCKTHRSSKIQSY